MNETGDRVVVIDPEDEAEVWRLVRAFFAPARNYPYSGIPAFSTMQEALREFANGNPTTKELRDE